MVSIHRVDRCITVCRFYRAMHYSAKRGLAIACRLSVCPSVCDVGGLWSHKLEFFWNSVRSLQTQTSGVYSKGSTPEILAQSDPPPVDLSVGDIRSQIAAEWLHIAQPSQWRAYRKPLSLSNGATHRWPLRPHLPQNGVSYAPKIREWPYLRNVWSDTLHVWF